MGSSNIEVTGVNDILKKLQNIKFDSAERSEIIEYSAPVVEDWFYHITPYKQGENVNDKTLYGKKIGHLRDGITHKKFQYPDGSTRIGFNYKVAPIAVWTNDGTYRQAPQHWYEKNLDNFPTQEVYSAQKIKAKEILARKGIL